MPTWNDPTPLANPFSQRVFGNFNINRASRDGYIRRCADPSRLEVPNQDIPPNGSEEWYAMMRERSAGLEVPNQDIPLGDRAQGAGFLDDRHFRLADGSVIDFRTGRMAAPPGRAKTAITAADAGFAEPPRWGPGAGPTLDELIRDVDAWKGTAVPGCDRLEPIDPKSAAYWLKAEEEAEKLRSSMTDEQKAALAAFEAHFPKSRLIEEAKKAPFGKLL